MLAIRSIGVVGAGQMGMGIALVAASRASVPVRVYDTSSAQIEKGLKLVDKLLAKDVTKGRLDEKEVVGIRGRIQVVSSMDKLDSDMIIEATAENFEVKRSVFASLSKACSPNTVLATNTSSISITKIAATAAKPEMVVGLHFFNPVPVMPLVELIPGLQTSPETLATAKAFAIACGKEVTHSADVPGFVSNALLMPFLNEAIMCLEKGVATKEDIDKTLRLGMNHPMGPLTLADFIGLDTCLSIQQVLHRETGDDKYRPSVLLRKMVDAGWLGRKSGKGFYEYNES